MKTAKKWMNELAPPLTIKGQMAQTLVAPIGWEDVQQIQLDAAKWATKQVADLIGSHKHSEQVLIEGSLYQARSSFQQAVNNFANNLTIDQLPK